MAIYHCSIKIGRRGAGRSACGAAAYRAADKVQDRETGLTHDFQRKSGVVHDEIMLCKNAPEEYMNRETLWNSAQAAERQKDGQLFREVEVALPNEMTRDQQIEAVREYCFENFVAKGMCCDWALHDKGDGNPHAHIMTTMRGIKNGKWEPKRRDVYANDRDASGKAIYNPDKPSGKEHRIPRLDKDGNQKLDKKGGRVWERLKVDVNDWNNPANAERWREAWARTCNRYLDQEHRIDHRSFERRGIGRIPTKHEGFAARQLERRGGKSTVCEVNREIRRLNDARHQLELERRAVIVSMERDKTERSLRQMREEIQAISNYRTDCPEKSKKQKQIDAIRRRKRSEKASSNIAVEIAIQSLANGSEVASDCIKKMTTDDVAKLADAAQKTFVKALRPNSDLPRIAAVHAFKTICACAARGDKGADAFLHMSKPQEIGLPKEWLYMSEADRSEYLLKRAYADDYGDDEKSLMSGYKLPQVTAPETAPKTKKPKRVRTQELGGR